MPSSLETLKSRLADVNALQMAGNVLDWDQQTYMPHGGSEARARHTETLSRMAHEIFTADATREALEGAKGEAEGDDALMLPVAERDLALATKLPTELVARKAGLASLAHEAWVTARAADDFAAFAPTLEKMFDIAREEAGHLGYTESMYDALLDQYEQGATAAEARAMFDALKGPQVALVKRIAARPETDDSVLTGDWDEAKQREFSLKLVAAIGYDLSRGRLDKAPHPFCTNFSIGDVRLTTRYKPYLPSAIFGSLHEAGHGVYEQGSPMAWDGTPLAGGVSLGLHESQSRTWENIVGRSRPFWARFLPDLQAAFPALGGVKLDDFYRKINKVRPTLIRVEADELTYNLHVLVRFEIEQAILDGELKVADLPDAWNAKYEEYLGITPDSDANGCLQDVHWSMGSIGYFPTYTMGNVLSYAIWNKLRESVGDTDALIEGGHFEPILGWLQENLYRHGRSIPPKELVARITGEPMNPQLYLDGLSAKYRAIYELD